MKWLRYKKKIMFTILLIILISILLFFFREFISNYLVRFNLTDIEAPGKNSKVLIFSPHNDDEVLGAAELIKNSVKSGAEVKVVLITNGDGFKEAIQFDYFNLHPKPKDYIKFGYTRQQESINALKTLGVPEKNITFLGYPDGGVSYLWSSYWDREHLYISKNTQSNKSPYSNSYTKGSLYAGESVVSDMTKIINDYKPTHIIYPHPNDRHPDHWAVNAFVKYTLTTMNYKPNKEWLYLVHRGDWPTPMKKEISMYLVPPAKLMDIDTNWHAFSIGIDDIKEKEKVIHFYKTQIRTLGPLMTAFERKNELFGEYKNLDIKTSKYKEENIIPSVDNKIISDPLQDALTLEISKGSDIHSIYLQQDYNKNLNFFIETDGEIEESTKYSINLILFQDNKNSKLNIGVKNNKVTNENISKESITNINGIKSEYNKNILHITIPYSIVGDFKHIFVNANTSIEDRMLDRTAWRMIDKK